MTMAKKKKEKSPATFPPAVLDAILRQHTVDGVVTPAAMFGSDGVLQQLTKALVERALAGEMEHHLGYPKHGERPPEAHQSGNAATAPRLSRSRASAASIQSKCRATVSASSSPRSSRKASAALTALMTAFSRCTRVV